MELPFKRINYDKDCSEFDFTLTPDCDDRIETALELHDYDWMSYKFHAIIPHKEQGLLHFVTEYFGTTNCEAEIVQQKGDVESAYKLTFPVDVFVKFITEYLTEWMKQWEPEAYAFCGEKFAIKFFNDVLEKATSCEKIQLQSQEETDE